MAALAPQADVAIERLHESVPDARYVIGTVACQLMDNLAEGGQISVPVSIREDRTQFIFGPQRNTRYSRLRARETCEQRMNTSATQRFEDGFFGIPLAHLIQDQRVTVI